MLFHATTLLITLIKKKIFNLLIDPNNENEEGKREILQKRANKILPF